MARSISGVSGARRGWEGGGLSEGTERATSCRARCAEHMWHCPEEKVTRVEEKVTSHAV